MALSTEDRNSRTRREAPESYRAYLNSPHWRQTRNAALKRAHWRCNRCGGKRDLNVHHRSYERLGAERDSDLEVLCFTCHNGHHVEEAKEQPAGVYLKLVSEVVAANPFAQVADIADETKRACVRHRVPVNVALIDRAISLVCATRLQMPQQPRRTVNTVEEDGLINQSGVHAVPQGEAVEILARLRAALGAPPIKRMPKVKVVTAHTAAKVKAFEMVTREMEASIARCEALEQEIA